MLKCTHDCGSVILVKEKSRFDKKAARRKIEKCLKRNQYYPVREWPYKNVPPRIIAEPYLCGTKAGEGLTEYKIFCFGGKPKVILVCKGMAHGTGRTNDFCDTEFNLLPFTSFNSGSDSPPGKPKEIDTALKLAESLSAGIPVLRVDTYIIDNKIYVGELTFFHNSGVEGFEPPVWDEKLGKWIELPDKAKI